MSLLRLPPPAATARRGAELTSPLYPPYQIAFDEDKLLWELEFFTKHFLEGYRGVQIPPSDRATS